ncbi:MAG: YfiR family protein [bacterium]
MLLAIAGRAHSQVPADEAQIKAAFVYNFLKFVDWPESAVRRSDDPLVVAIIGEGSTADAVAALLATKRVGDRPIVIRHLTWDQPLAGIQAAFISEGDSKRLRRVFDAAAGAAVLSIGETYGFASHGGVIGLLVDERKVRFDIDTDAADAARLHISSKLLALGRIVHAGKTSVGETP